MSTRLLRWTTLVAVALAAWNLGWVSTATCWAEADEAAPAAETPTQPAKPATTPAKNGEANLGPGAFNYYVHPGEGGWLGAQLYLSPRPTPQVVGHTYVTYPPLMPHEFLYRHHRTYKTYNPGSGWTRTRASWR